MSNTVTITLKIPSDMVYDPDVVYHISQVKKIINASNPLPNKPEASSSVKKIRDTLSALGITFGTYSSSGNKTEAQPSSNSKVRDTVNLIKELFGGDLVEGLEESNREMETLLNAVMGCTDSHKIKDSTSPYVNELIRESFEKLLTGSHRDVKDNH